MKAATHTARAHLLVDSTLSTIATAQMLGVPVSSVSSENLRSVDRMKGSLFLSTHIVFKHESSAVMEMQTITVYQLHVPWPRGDL